MHLRSRVSRPKSISVAKSAKLGKSTTEKRDPKKQLSLSIADRDRNLTQNFGREHPNVPIGTNAC